MGKEKKSIISHPTFSEINTANIFIYFCLDFECRGKHLWVSIWI